MDKKFSRQLDNQVSDGGHETHTTALVLMVLFTGLVLTIALGGTDSFSQTENSDTPATSSEVVTETTSTTSIGSGQVATAANLLNSIPVEPGVEVTNQMVTRDGEPAEQIISYKTTRTNGDLAQTYRDWLATNNYTIVKDKVGNYAASLAATRDDSALVILISYLDTEDMARVEIINYRR